MAKFDVTQESKLTKQQIVLLVAHAVRLPVVYSEAKSRLKPTHFEADEKALAILWNIASRLLVESGANLHTNPSFELQIQSEARRDADSAIEVGVSAAELGETFGTDKSAKGLQRSKKCKNTKSILREMFAIPVDQLDSRHGLRLLKQFLRERAICLPLKQSFEGWPEFIPASLPAFIRELNDVNQAIEQILPNRQLTLADGMAEFEQYRKRFVGKAFLGLRTGMDALDRCTLGLRGTMIIGARPNVGKTALALHLGLSTLQQSENSNVALLLISLDMERSELKSRILANLSGVDMRYVMTENSPATSLEKNRWNTAIKSSMKRMKGDLGRRITIYDQSDLRGELTAERLAACIDRTKKDCAATRVLTVIDYLQLLDVPELVAKQGDLAADKHRIRLVQQARELTSSVENPKGEPQLVISEARKPSSSKEAWGTELAELMGSARLGYAADAVLSIRDMELEEFKSAYGIHVDQDAESHRNRLSNSGKAPLVLKLVKARDGMTRGHWGVEFSFRSYKFEEKPLVHVPTIEDELPANARPALTPKRTARRRGRRT